MNTSTTKIHVDYNFDHLGNALLKCHPRSSPCGGAGPLKLKFCNQHIGLTRLQYNVFPFHFSTWLPDQRSSG